MGENISPTLISGYAKQIGTTQDKLGVMVLNDQGGQQMDITEDMTGTLRAQEHGHQPIVCGISAYESNSMKSSNPHSGIYEADTTRTLDNNGGNPACNQGGMAVVCYDGSNITCPVNASNPQPGDPCHTLHDDSRNLVVIEGNGSRPSHQGDGYKESDISYTLNAVEQHAVCIENHPADSRVKISEDGIVQTLSSRMGTGGGNVPMTMEKNTVVRRLTPLECERLQGYPDGWTDIGEWNDTKGKKHKEADSPRYKALGNSIALPFWEWMAKRMVQYVEKPTMASLFDGIGGFPLVYSRAGCEPVWASEIEEFPIAVTKRRFPDD